MHAAVRTNSSSRVIKEQGLLGSSWRLVRPTGASNEDEPQCSSEALVQEANERAMSILAQAQAQAEETLAQAEQSAAQVLEKAREAGYREGYQLGLDKGVTEALSQNEGIASRLLSLASAAEREQMRLLSALEPQLVELSLAIARKIVGQELATRPEAITDIIARAIEGAGSGGHRVIRLHPEDSRLLKPYLSPDAIAAGGGEWEIEADDSLERGDCLIETAFGVVDASVGTQFEELHALLLGRESCDAIRS